MIFLSYKYLTLSEMNMKRWKNTSISFSSFMPLYRTKFPTTISNMPTTIGGSITISNMPTTTHGPTIINFPAPVSINTSLINTAPKKKIFSKDNKTKPNIKIKYKRNTFYSLLLKEFPRISFSSYFELIFNKTNGIFLYDQEKQIITYLNKINLKQKIKINYFRILIRTNKMKMVRINKIEFLIKVFTENPQEFFYF